MPLIENIEKCNDCVEGIYVCPVHKLKKTKKTPIKRPFRHRTKQPFIDIVIDGNEYVLSRLCCRKHEYKNTGMSLRRRCNRSCVECEKITRKEYLLNNREKISNQNKAYRASLTKETIKRKNRIRYIKYKDIILERNRRYQRTSEKNKIYRKAYNSKYMKVYCRTDSFLKDAAIRGRKARADLVDHYIVSTLINAGYEREHITGDLIEFKRSQMLLFREIVKIKKEVRDGFA